VQEDLRRRVVRAIVDDGMKRSEATRVFSLSYTAVHKWVQQYHTHGPAGLKEQKRGRPRWSRLAGHQAATVVRLITDRCPDQLKLPFALWTREAVQQLIAKRYEIHESVWSIGVPMNKTLKKLCSG